MSLDKSDSSQVIFQAATLILQPLRHAPWFAQRLTEDLILFEEFSYEVFLVRLEWLWNPASPILSLLQNLLDLCNQIANNFSNIDVGIPTYATHMLILD